jgi:hypothetical protein
MRLARAHHRCADDARVGHFVGESPAINDIGLPVALYVGIYAWNSLASKLAGGGR